MGKENNGVCLAGHNDDHYGIKDVDGDSPLTGDGNSKRG